MSKYKLPFGDWSRDGHGECVYKIVECEDPDIFYKAEKAIKEKYGKYFFGGMANKYQEPVFSEEVWDVLIETNFPLETFYNEMDEGEYYKEKYNFQSFKELANFLKNNNDYFLSIEFVIAAYFHLMRAFGATEFEIVPDIPLITNVAAPGYGSLGY